jgi:sugar lactone lactonase YvrE
MKKLLYFYIFLCSLVGFSQENQQWGSYFSYNNIVDITQSNSTVFASAESAYFSQNTLTEELRTTTSVDGLKAETITAIYYSPGFNRMLVGSASGLLVVVNGDGSIVTKNDIVKETTVVGSKKKINSFFEHNGLAYIATDYGISVFNLATLEFKDTYYLGPAGAEIAVNQATVRENTIYASTNQNGVRFATLSNPNLNDFNQWNEYFGGGWFGVTTLNNNVYSVADTQIVYQITDGIPRPMGNLPSRGLDIRAVNGLLVVTCANKVNIYNDANQLVYEFNVIPDQTETITFTCATIVNERLYIGTKEKGVFTTPLSTLNFTNITPDGPLRNSIFSLEKTPNFLWAVFGTYDFYYTPDYSENGVSKLGNMGWKSIPYPELSKLGRIQSISDITINPKNEKEVYLNSAESGLLKLVDDVPTIFYQNPPLENEQLENTSSIRVNGGTFDKDGNLWVMNSMTKKPLKVLRAGTTNSWVSYDFKDIIGDFASVRENYGRLTIDRNGTKWIATTDFGLIAFNEALNNKNIIVGLNEGLPNTYVKCSVIDKNNRLWIGTVSGLSVISSIDNFTSGDALQANPIIIVEDGIAQELMYQQVVTDIEVDGSNNKWIGTTAGAFLVSPDGQNTLFHFTKENSPLPSNVINDIAINSVTGEVFFATQSGMVSYKGSSTAASEDLNSVVVYPNPVRPGFEGTVKVSGLIDRANVKITDIEGNLVYETTSVGGTILWDTKVFGRNKVRSGVYLILVASDDGTIKTVNKVMVVR